MAMELYWLTLSILAVWRLSHLLAAEDGPFDLFARLREAAGNSFFGKLLDCFNCVSLWVSAPVALLLGRSVQEQSLLWLACSGGAIMLERLTASRAAPAPLYWEEEEKDELLRKPAQAESAAAIKRVYDKPAGNAADGYGKADNRL